MSSTINIYYHAPKVHLIEKNNGNELSFLLVGFVRVDPFQDPGSPIDVLFEIPDAIEIYVTYKTRRDRGRSPDITEI